MATAFSLYFYVLKLWNGQIMWEPSRKLARKAVMTRKVGRQERHENTWCICIWKKVKFNKLFTLDPSYMALSVIFMLFRLIWLDIETGQSLHLKDFKYLKCPCKIVTLWAAKNQLAVLAIIYRTDPGQLYLKCIFIWRISNIWFS